MTHAKGECLLNTHDAEGERSPCENVHAGDKMEIDVEDGQTHRGRRVRGPEDPDDACDDACAAAAAAVKGHNILAALLGGVPAIPIYMFSGEEEREEGREEGPKRRRRELPKDGPREGDDTTARGGSEIVEDAPHPSLLGNQADYSTDSDQELLSFLREWREDDDEEDVVLIDVDVCGSVAEPLPKSQVDEQAAVAPAEPADEPAADAPAEPADEDALPAYRTKKYWQYRCNYKKLKDFFLSVPSGLAKFLEEFEGFKEIRSFMDAKLQSPPPTRRKKDSNGVKIARWTTAEYDRAATSFFGEHAPKPSDEKYADDEIEYVHATIDFVLRTLGKNPALADKIPVELFRRWYVLGTGATRVHKLFKPGSIDEKLRKELCLGLCAALKVLINPKKS